MWIYSFSKHVRFRTLFHDHRLDAEVARFVEGRLKQRHGNKVLCEPAVVGCSCSGKQNDPVSFSLIILIPSLSW